MNREGNLISEAVRAGLGKLMAGVRRTQEASMLKIVLRRYPLQAVPIQFATSQQCLSIGGIDLKDHVKVFHGVSRLIQLLIKLASEQVGFFCGRDPSMGYIPVQ